MNVTSYRYDAEGPNIQLLDCDEIRIKQDDLNFCLRIINNGLEVVTKTIGSINSKCEYGVWGIMLEGKKVDAELQSRINQSGN